MKPILIYSLPRTRSSAVLQAAKRTNKHWEPFNYHKLFGAEIGKFLRNKSHLLPQFYNSLDESSIQKIFDKINQPNSATKITCLELFDFLPSRFWYNQIQINNSHEIFVLTRNLKEQIISYLLAPHFGYFKDEGIEPKPLTLPFDSLFYVKTSIDLFLRFLPKNINEITFEDLPTEYFDKATITLESQNSLEKLRYINNYNEISTCIDDLINYYKIEWNSKSLRSL